MYPVTYDTNTLVHLVDAPGFNDTVKTDADVLEEIASFLTTTYQQGTTLDGIIYLQRITDVRMEGSSMKSLRTLRKICGRQFYKKIMLVTTRWEQVTDKARAEATEQELTSTSDFWGTMIKGGCRTGRHDNTQASALKLIGSFIEKRNENVALDIQKEMVEQNKELIDTNAGQEVDERYAEQVKKAKREVNDVKKELRSALEERDRDWLKQLKVQQEQAIADAANIEEDYKRLGKTMQRKYEASCNRLRLQLTMLRLENKKYSIAASPRQPLPKIESYRTRYRSGSGTKSQSSDQELQSSWDTLADQLEFEKIFARVSARGGLSMRDGKVQLLSEEHEWLCEKNKKSFLLQPVLLELKAPLVVSRQSLQRSTFLMRSRSWAISAVMSTA